MMVLTGSLQSIFLKGMSTAMINYPYTLLIFPLVGTAIIFFPLTWWRMYVLKKIPDDASNWAAKGKICVMAVCDQLADFLIIYGTAATSGYLTPIFTQVFYLRTLFYSQNWRLFSCLGSVVWCGSVGVCRAVRWVCVFAVF